MMRRSRIMRGALVVLAGAWMLASPTSMRSVGAQSSWPFQLEWTQAGAPSYYRLCVNGNCSVLGDAHKTQGSVWRATLPMLPPGEYRLVVEACNEKECLAGEPDMVIRVVPASSRRPPIDVIEGPRIPVSR